MLYEKVVSGPKRYIIDNTREEVKDGLSRMKPGTYADFKHERGDVGRIIFDSEKLATEVTEMQIKAGFIDIYDKELQAERREQVLKVIDAYIQRHLDWQLKRIVPYRSDEEMIRGAGIFPCPYCTKVFTNEKSDNPQLDLQNHIALTKDGKHPKLEKKEK